MRKRGCRPPAAGGVLATLLALIAMVGPACGPRDSTQAKTVVDAWDVHRLTREGPGERLGSLRLTDPAGGPPHGASVGSHGLRIEIDSAAGVEKAGAEGRELEVRVVYSREGAADTRSFVAVGSPGETGVYLGTVDLTAPGEWRFRIIIVGAEAGGSSITVPES